MTAPSRNPSVNSIPASNRASATRRTSSPGARARMLTLAPKSYSAGSRCIPGVMIDPPLQMDGQSKCWAVIIWHGEKPAGTRSGRVVAILLQCQLVTERTTTHSQFALPRDRGPDLSLYLEEPARVQRCGVGVFEKNSGWCRRNTTERIL